MIKFIQSKATTLTYSIDSSATEIQVDELLKLDGTSMTAADIGDSLTGTFDPGTDSEEIFEIDGANVTVESDGKVTITNVVRGLLDVEPYTTGGFATSHGTGAQVVFGNNPQVYNKMAVKANDNTFTGANTFPTNPRKGDSVLATNNDDYITKADLLNAVLGAVTTDQVIISGTAGETVTAKQILYFKESDQRWWKADADIVGTFNQVIVAVAQNGATAGVAVNLLLQGVDKTQTGLTLGAKYYLSNTAGAISTTPGTTEVFLGWAQTATRFIFDPLGLYQPTSGEKAAMAGTSGTAPSSLNKFVDNADTSTTGSGSKIPRGSSGKLDPSWIPDLAFSAVSGENISANKPVYINPSDSSVYTAHGFKSIDSTAISLTASTTNKISKLSDTQMMFLTHSGATLTITIYDINSGASVATQTVTTSFDTTSADTTLTGASVCRMTDTTFIVFYARTSSSLLYFRTGTISGGTITMDTETQYTGNPEYVYGIDTQPGASNGKK
jgi:hypothetical protein